jgi:hypothetical protein
MIRTAMNLFLVCCAFVAAAVLASPRTWDER